ncbi:hypothetical protein QJS10_CPA16g00535 [Acorus calamus]|uniref:Uncharacterized protein n=1 Tax=Acorus calamus TaxID=4465 RepID=A0AAV9D0J5_ACOCL|nr:hypothetical protein QJS10_CPA16g00535 [Acorus calamus]
MGRKRGGREGERERERVVYLVYCYITGDGAARDTKTSRSKKEEEQASQAIDEEGKDAAAWDNRRKNRSKKGRSLRWWSEKEQ